MRSWRNIWQEIQKKVSSGWDQRKVIPYVQKHEFEGLLFSDVSAFSVLTGATDRLVEELGTSVRGSQILRTSMTTPDTAPSKRIKKHDTRVPKGSRRTLIARETGLDAIRAECPRFAEWLAKLESLGGLLKPA